MVAPATRTLVRGMHTTARALNEPITSNFLARLGARSAEDGSGSRFPRLGSSSTASSSSANGGARPAANINDTARGMISDATYGGGGFDGRKRFVASEVVAPHAYSRKELYVSEELRRPGPRPPLLGPPKAVAKRIDPFCLTRTSPLDHTMNPNIVHHYMNAIGKIQGRAETGLTWKNQRLVGKMVRRARAMGVVSKWAKVSRGQALGAFYPRA